MGLYDMKLGEEVKDKGKSFGILNDVFSGKVRLLKISYCFQDEEGVEMTSSLIHKDYIKSEEDGEKTQ